MATLTLLQGPAGSGKSQIAREMMEDDPSAILADFTALWAAMRGVERDPETRKYPVRKADDPVVESGVGTKIKKAVAREALRADRNVIVTTATKGMEIIWKDFVEVQDGNHTYQVRTVERTLLQVKAELVADGEDWSDECREAVGRWFKGQLIL